MNLSVKLLLTDDLGLRTGDDRSDEDDEDDDIGRLEIRLEFSDFCLTGEDDGVLFMNGFVISSGILSSS